MSLAKTIIEKVEQLSRPCPDSKVCVCPSCGHRMEVEAGKPCKEVKCPKCGDIMMRPTVEPGNSSVYGD